ncbi:MAG: MORN motif-containing protein [Cyanobacteriota bacterium]|nr:MORN motif-containing protein [Cyanobacteriota bacterium]
MAAVARPQHSSAIAIDTTYSNKRTMKNQFGVFLSAALLFELAGLLAPPEAAMAQEGAGERPPICEPAVLSGFTRCNYEGGDNYVGFVANGLPNGRGTFVYSGGDRYEGEFRNGLPNGRGRFVFQDDARYEGTFRNGVFVSGRAIYSNGDVYEGSFDVVRNVESGEVSSQPGGRGTFRFANGSRYVGEFFAGQPFGKGTFVHVVNGVQRLRCDGQFFNESLDGKGTCTYNNGDRYQGEYRQGLPHGTGTLIRSDGSRFSGLFRGGQPFTGEEGGS